MDGCISWLVLVCEYGIVMSLFNVCSAVTVECYFIPVLSVCVWYVCCYDGIRLFSSVFAITERMDMGLYDSMHLSCFGMGTMLSNFHRYDITTINVW